MKHPSYAIIFDRVRIDEKQDRPLVAQIADQIHWLIVSKQINPGDRLPPVRELARHLQINLHTVRAAYHRLEENKMIYTRRGIGSVVVDYDLSDTICTNRILTHTFGVIVPDLANPFYPAFLSGAARVAQKHHVLLMTSDTQDNRKLAKAYFEMLIAKHVDGILLAPWGMGPHDDNIVSIVNGDLYNYPVPLVFVDQPDVDGYAVLLDSKNAGFLATQHLIEHGHTKIAIITGRLSVPTLYQVFEGYLSALELHGLKYCPQLVIEADNFSYAEGYRVTRTLIESGNLPTAIFAAGDMFAVGAMKALREKKLQVPGDVAIVGYNNIDVANFTQPTLTSVSTPIQELGEKSAELLLKLVNREPVAQRKIVLPSRLIVRESCGCQPSK